MTKIVKNVNWKKGTSFWYVQKRVLFDLLDPSITAWFYNYGETF